MNINTYIEGSSFYHKADSRAKLIFTVLMCITVFFRWDTKTLFIYVALSMVLSLLAVKAKETLKNIKLLLPVIFFMVLFLPLQNIKGKPFLSIGSFTLISDIGLNNFFSVSSRFVFLSLITVLLLETTKNNDLLLALRFFHLPYNGALIISLSLRFIPYLASIFADIKESQSLRLPNEGEEEVKQSRVKMIFPSLIAVMVYAIKSISTTASALELRGFSGKEKRSNFHRLKWNKTIFTEIILSVIIPLIFIFTLELLI